MPSSMMSAPAVTHASPILMESASVGYPPSNMASAPPAYPSERTNWRSGRSGRASSLTSPAPPRGPLSPRPTSTPGRAHRFLGRGVQASACAVSRAGMMPSKRATSLKPRCLLDRSPPHSAPPTVTQVASWAQLPVVQTCGHRVRLHDLPLLVLHHRRARSVQDCPRARTVSALPYVRVDSLAAGLHPNQLHSSSVEERRKRADRVRAPADTAITRPGRRPRARESASAPRRRSTRCRSRTIAGYARADDRADHVWVLSTFSTQS